MGRAGSVPPPVVGTIESVGGIGIVQAVLGIAVDIAIVNNRVGARVIVDAGLVLGKDGALHNGAGVLHIEAAVLAAHHHQVAQRRPAAVQEERTGGTVAAAVAQRYIVQS